MGKLNYAARKTQGVKAGQSVSKDLKKKIPPGTGSKAAARDPYLEIDLTGKGLTDDGFAQFIDDLIACLDFRGDDHPEGAVKLTELSLKGNKLTIASMEKLGKVIERSHGDLKDLDISENQITIEKPEHAAIWKGFLDAFQGCFVLKRIDFSGNKIGARGFELLCRAYIHSDLDFFDNIDDDDAVESGSGENVEGESALQETMSSLSLGGDKENVKPSPEPTKGGKAKATRAARASSAAAPAAMSKAEIKRFACTRGLRSVPFLIFTNMGMTKACAFHLSVILLEHHHPDALLNFLPSGKSLSPPQVEDDVQCHGIVYMPNENFEKAGKRLIDLAEILRQEVFESDSDSDESSSQAAAPGATIPGPYSLRLGWDEEKSAERREMRQRHQTILGRYKKLLLLDVLKEDGLHSAEIWSVAFNMMVVSRAILLEDQFRPVKASTEISDEDEASKEIAAPEVSTGPTLSQELLSGRFIEDDELPLFAPERDDFDINFPAIQDNDCFPYLPSQMQMATVLRPSTPEPTGGNGRKKPHSNGHGRSAPACSSTSAAREFGRFGLPMEIWRVIIAKAVGAEGILSEEQQRTIMRYASDWNSLDQERSVQGAAENQQIWKILESVGCFAYASMP